MPTLGHIGRRLGILLFPVALALFPSSSFAQSESLITEYACSRSYESVAYIDQPDYRSSAYLGWVVVSIPPDCYRRGYVHLIDVQLSCAVGFHVRLTNPDPPDDPLVVSCVGGLPRRQFGDPVLFHDFTSGSSGMDRYYEVVSSVPVQSRYRVVLDVYRVLTAYSGAYTPVPSPFPTPFPTPVSTPPSDVVCQQEYLDGFADLRDNRYLGRLMIAYEGVSLLRDEYVRRVLGDPLRFVAGVDYSSAFAEGARLDVCNEVDLQTETVSLFRDSYQLFVFFGVVAVSLLSVLVLRR